ncbi:uncharacterized protein BX663DRAFT_484132 [Cokeromyces recurvatus]|uniref:uncharacterized protein n=1 Tax=Cokeromyces recurvatus TaxID=90255 RepID=UPI00222055A9|nr:uncharacterized protein BX663DRAFT_484132 [Cokeromyces recurvatus]KAI7905649.1 hypothetical protein BX663DRAFT_484132 [Cokeromyces recurvatus]
MIGRFKSCFEHWKFVVQESAILKNKEPLAIRFFLFARTHKFSIKFSFGKYRVKYQVADKRVIAVKTTVKNIWKPAYIKPLQDLVDIINTIVTPTFAFIKYIFVSELVRNIEFDLKSYVNKSFFFFVKVFLSLTLRRVQDGTKSGK